MKIGIFGLGSMGLGMALSLHRAGHKVWGFDIDPNQVEKFVEKGGLNGNIEDIVPELDIVVLVVLNASQTERILFGDSGIVKYMNASSAVISSATVAPEFARAMSTKCSEQNIFYLDAPISGGSVKAEQGKLSIMASGQREAFEIAQPALDAMAETVFTLGDSAGAGSAMKAVNQLLAGVHIAAMAEAMTFGMKQGIEPATIVDIISQCAGTSWMFENRAPHIVAGDYTPKSMVDIWLKDLGIILDIAKGEKVSAPLTAAALQQFVAASGSGFGREDDAAVAKVYARNANIVLPGEK